MVVETFLQDIYETKCHFGIRNDHEVNDIESAVKDIILNIIQLLATANPLLTMSDLLPTGGYYEETKIENPNEFDFMLVSEVASLETEFKMESGCPGCVSLKALHPERWSLICSEDGSFCFASRELDIPVDGSNLAFSYNLCYEEILSRVGESEEAKKCVEKPTGKLYLIGTGSKSLSLAWESFSRETICENPEFGIIDVDIMPCIRISEDIMKEILENVPLALHKYVRNDGCHIVPKNCHVSSKHFCCQVSFSRSELFMVREMGDHHIKCYKILKVIGSTLSCLCFDSYAMKTAVLYHSYIDCCVEDGAVYPCVLKVLTYLKECSENKFLPTIFLPSKNIWEYSLIKEMPAAYKAQAGLAGLLISILQHILETGDHQEYTFKKCYELFEKLKEYLSDLSDGKIDFAQLEKKMKKFLRKRKLKEEKKNGNKSQHKHCALT